MRTLLITVLASFLVPLASAASETQKTYRWKDSEGLVHFGDTIPAEYAEMDKQILNEHGIVIERLRGKKSPEEIAEEKRQEQLAMEIEMQRRADQALLATYMSVEEIQMHRDRRVELFQAQSRVTELYLRNLQRRLEELVEEASRFQPYNSDPDAALIDPDLSDDITMTRETIVRHEGNLRRFAVDESEIIARFEGDITRFRGLTASASQSPN